MKKHKLTSSPVLKDFVFETFKALLLDKTNADANVVYHTMLSPMLKDAPTMYNLVIDHYITQILTLKNVLDSEILAVRLEPNLLMNVFRPLLNMPECPDNTITFHNYMTDSQLIESLSSALIKHGYITFTSPDVKLTIMIARPGVLNHVNL
jgi:hypothetical protein